MLSSTSDVCLTNYNTTVTFCSDCWRSSATNTVCKVLFWTYFAATILVLILIMEHTLTRQAVNAVKGAKRAKALNPEKKKHA